MPEPCYREEGGWEGGALGSLRASSHPSVEGKKGKEAETHERETGAVRRWGRAATRGAGINGCMLFKLAPDDGGGLTMFQSIISRFSSITQSFSLPQPTEATCPQTFNRFHLNRPRIESSPPLCSPNPILRAAWHPNLKILIETIDRTRPPVGGSSAQMGR